MPTRRWYAVAAIVFVAGVVGSVLLVATRLAGLTSGLQQVVVPGERDLQLDEAGSYTLFHETRSIVDGQFYSTPELLGLEFAVVSVATDSALDIAAPTANVSYDVKGRSGVAIGTFEVPAAGRYRFLAGYPDGRDEPRGVLAVGKGVGSAIMSTVVSAFAIGFSAFLIACFIAFRTYRRRRSWRAASGA